MVHITPNIPQQPWLKLAPTRHCAVSSTSIIDSTLSSNLSFFTADSVSVSVSPMSPHGMVQRDTAVATVLHLWRQQPTLPPLFPVKTTWLSMAQLSPSDTFFLTDSILTIIIAQHQSWLKLTQLSPMFFMDGIHLDLLVGPRRVFCSLPPISPSFRRESSTSS
jgi:hypothetical protein